MAKRSKQDIYPLMKIIFVHVASYCVVWNVVPNVILIPGHNMKSINAQIVKWIVLIAMHTCKRKN